ncbi:NAD-P-binding protein [Lentinus brumalis]|uniref:NAD-P-binding protein n=1 Tax=Lentinus brumalis TaxID=2498619 RepID=A0A371DEI1_9APHY|nr:NAD-P-binding protein [Polyporus brumalis]
MPASRVWLVTGASSGFGLEMVRCALSHGDKVVATLRKPAVLADFASQYQASQFILVELDVTKSQDIRAAFTKAKETFGRVDVVFNNAGFIVAGEAEGTPDVLARQMFEVNFWGAVHVSQEAVRFFRDENKPQGGYLIQNSAAVGIFAFPFLPFYGATKHALEGFTESLSHEVNPEWNIKITLVEPGAFKSDILSAMQVAPQHPAYANPTLPVSKARQLFEAGPKAGDFVENFGLADTVEGVQKIYELTTVPNPPLRLPLAHDAVGRIRDWALGLVKNVDAYASWSDGLAS